MSIEEESRPSLPPKHTKRYTNDGMPHAASFSDNKNHVSMDSVFTPSNHIMRNNADVSLVRQSTSSPSLPQSSSMDHEENNIYDSVDQLNRESSSAGSSRPTSSTFNGIGSLESVDSNSEVQVHSIPPPLPKPRVHRQSSSESALSTQTSPVKKPRPVRTSISETVNESPGDDSPPPLPKKVARNASNS